MLLQLRDLTCLEEACLLGPVRYMAMLVVISPFCGLPLLTGVRPLWRQMLLRILGRQMVVKAARLLSVYHMMSYNPVEIDDGLNEGIQNTPQRREEKE